MCLHPRLETQIENVTRRFSDSHFFYHIMLKTLKIFKPQILTQFFMDFCFFFLYILCHFKITIFVISSGIRYPNTRSKRSSTLLFWWKGKIIQTNGSHTCWTCKQFSFDRSKVHYNTNFLNLNISACHSLFFFHVRCFYYSCFFCWFKISLNRITSENRDLKYFLFLYVVIWLMVKSVLRW